MHLGGKTLNIIAGDYCATITTMGGAIAALRYKDKNITRPFDPESVPVAYQGKIMAPWANRVHHGSYNFQAKQYQLPINDLKYKSAINGIVAWQDWDIIDMRVNKVELSTYISPIYGYPFLVKLDATYEVIDGMGLKVDIKAVNLGREDAPYGIGVHPFITCDSLDLNKCALTLPFSQVFSRNEEGQPLDNVPVESLGLDFRQPRLLTQDLVLNHCFITEDENRVSTVTLEGKRLKVYVKASCPFVQVYISPLLEFNSIAIEPMTCAPDSFNNSLGLISLKPHQFHSFNFLIGALEV